MNRVKPSRTDRRYCNKIYILRITWFFCDSTAIYSPLQQNLSYIKSISLCIKETVLLDFSVEITSLGG